MNVELKKIQSSLIVVLALLLIGLLAYFFLVLQPLKQDVANKERELALEEEVLASIENSQGKVETYEDHEIQAMLRTVPVHPWIDHWILDLEKAELVSDTEISSYSFSKGLLQGDSFSNYDQEIEDVESNEDEDVVVDLEDEYDFDETEEETNTVALGEGEEVNQVTANLSVTADSYDQLFQFLYEIEQLDRFTEIYALSFQAPSEAMLVMDQGDDPSEELLSFEVNVSTYYVDDLASTFADYKPSRPFVEPEMKDTPIYQNP